MAYAFGPGKIVEDGLVFYVDAANKDSYVSGSSDTFGLITPSLTGSLKNDTSFASSNAGIWEFDGSDEYIDFGNLLTLKDASVITWNLWVNFAAQSFNIVFGKGASPDVIQFYTWSFGPGVGYFFLKTANVGTTAVINPFIGSLINLNEWNMFTIVFDGNETGNDRLKIYLNGGSSNIITSYGGTPPATLPDTTDSFYISKGTNGTFDGEISNFKMYNKVLSAQEVLQNYNALKGRFI